MYDSYETDSRVIAGNRGDWFKSIDHSRNIVTITIHNEDGDDDLEPTEYDQEFPTKWEVCGTCDGRGSHVNPSIDCNGLSAEDFQEDPDFAADYFGGAYDQTCNECGGRSTVPVIDDDRCNAEQMTALVLHRQKLMADAEFERECAWERRMGC